MTVGGRRDGDAVGAPQLRHPHRVAAIVHLCLGGVIVVVSWLAGDGVGRGVVIAVAYVAAAVAWSWWRFRQRARPRVAREEKT